MAPEYYWWHGMWFFPMIFPVLGFTVMLAVVYLIFGRGFRPPWQDDKTETNQIALWRFSKNATPEVK